VHTSSIATSMEWDKTVAKKCPSCLQERDTCAHVLYCNHAGRVGMLWHTIDLLEEWMIEAGTDPDLLDCIAEYACGWGGCTMVDICQRLGANFQQMAHDQDTINWRWFMESMISTHVRRIQSLYHYREGTHMAPEWWAKGLILKLFEAIHGQWIYWNIQIHDSVAGTQAPFRRRRSSVRSRNRW
jgi:hypothetical protein